MIENSGNGHAIHFRCQRPDVSGIRLDIMTTMRGCDRFELLWERRLTLHDDDGMVYELMGIEDLAQAKKTQGDKDWPMIQRLLDAHYEEFHLNPSEDQIRFWLNESRTTEVLIALAAAYPDLCGQMSAVRPQLAAARSANSDSLKVQLRQEEAAERVADENYWQPLKTELNLLREQRRKNAEN